jgi:hypothetical protein
MAGFLRRFPAILSAIVLAAHFLRFGRIVGVVACLAAIPLFFWRARPAVLVSRLLLLLGAAFWVLATFSLVRMRRADGLPWIRLAVILGAVAAVAAISAWLLPGARSVAPPREPSA